MAATSREPPPQEDTTVKMTTEKKVSIFHYCQSKHRFSSPHISRRSDEKPSLDWLHDFHLWYHSSCEESCGDEQPSFDNIQDLQSFNRQGMELTKRLQQELPNVEVEPFQPVYDQVRVTCGWWHLRDEKYGFPVSIQKLPVSDELKADFTLWRYLKDANCLVDETRRHELEEEGKALQERLYKELHQEDEKKEEATPFGVTEKKAQNRRYSL